MAVMTDLLTFIGALAQILIVLLAIAAIGLFIKFVFDEWFR